MAQFTLTIHGDTDEELAHFAALLARPAVPGRVLLDTEEPHKREATVPAGEQTTAAPAEATEESVPAPKRRKRRKAAETSPAETAPAESDSVAADAVVVEPPVARTLDDLKNLVVERCTPTAANKLEVKACMAIIRELVGPKVEINRLDDVPADWVAKCYDAIAAA